jgi:pimeloyl-ACP methyl ester carboxylesterase
MRTVRVRRKVLGTAGVVAGVLATPLYRQYRRDIQAARERVRNLGSHVVSTGDDSIEYLTFGQGQPVLVVHGIVGGCDQALLNARDHVGEGFLSLLPSRFGYLRTPLPAGATPATQADTYVGLLDTLGIARAAIMGISAGGTSAIQFALRHPDRCAALVLLSSNAPAKVAVPSPPEPVARVIFRSEVAEVRAVCLPVSLRTPGILFDACVSNPDINSYPLGEITVPTLVIHAADDPAAPYENARALAEAIPGATLVTIERGGHLMLGQHERVRAEVTSFLTRHTLAVPAG